MSTMKFCAYIARTTLVFSAAALVVLFLAMSPCLAVQVQQPLVAPALVGFPLMQPISASDVVADWDYHQTPITHEIWPDHYVEEKPAGTVFMKYSKLLLNNNLTDPINPANTDWDPVGEFAFSADFLPTLNSPGDIGLVWGFSDHEHMYWFAWSGASGDGMRIVREDGPNTDHIPLAANLSNTFWEAGKSYAIGVQRIGTSDTYQVVVQDNADDSVIVDHTFSDSSVPVGPPGTQFGFFGDQTARLGVTNIEYVPEPSSLVLAGFGVLGVLGLYLARRRRARAAG